MNALKIVKLTASFLCALTYILFFFGVHAEAMFILPSVAYSLLFAADVWE
jgi:hypothetical protein